MWKVTKHHELDIPCDARPELTAVGLPTLQTARHVATKLCRDKTLSAGCPMQYYWWPGQLSPMLTQVEP